MSSPTIAERHPDGYPKVIIDQGICVVFPDHEDEDQEGPQKVRFSTSEKGAMEAGKALAIAGYATPYFTISDTLPPFLRDAVLKGHQAPILQQGTVLVFKEGVDPEEIRKLIAENMGHLLDTSYNPDGFHVNEFNRQHGGPVWYIP